MFVGDKHHANGNGMDPTATTKNEGERGRHAIQSYSPDSRFQARDEGKPPPPPRARRAMDGELEIIRWANNRQAKQLNEVVCTEFRTRTTNTIALRAKHVRAPTGTAVCCFAQGLSRSPPLPSFDALSRPSVRPLGSSPFETMTPDGPTSSSAVMCAFRGGGRSKMCCYGSPIRRHSLA
jgi:hypothetical protein